MYECLDSMCACMYVCAPICVFGAFEGQKSVGSPGTGVWDHCELPTIQVLELNLDPQPVLLIPESSLQPRLVCFV